MFSSHCPALLKTISVALMTLALCLLQACGLPQEQGGSDGSSSELDSDNDNTTENPDLAFSKTLIIKSEKLNGSTDLSLNSVSLVSLNTDFREISDGSLPDWQVTRSEYTGNVVLNIDSDYVEQLNHVIKVQHSDEEVYYAALPYIPIEINSTAEVSVNIFTHYLVKKLFDQLPNSDTLLTHLPCQNGEPIIGCNNQPRAKQDFVSMINNTAAEFSFELPSEISIDQALSEIDNQEHIRQLAESSITEIALETAPFAKGTMRQVTGLGFDNNGNVFSTPPPWPKTYNSAFLALSLSDVGPNDSVQIVKFAASNSTIVGNKELANELPAYPKYQSTTQLTDLRREAALFIDIPYERTSLTVNNQINAYEPVDRSEPINTYASASTPDSFLSRDGNLLEGRSLVSTQPGSVADAKDVVWRYEPIFAKLYQANEYEPDSVFVPGEEEENIDYGNEPTWLTSSGYTRAENYDVINPETENERLGEQLEDIHLFSWEVHGLQTPTSFSRTQVTGKEYGVITFSQKLNNTDNTVEIFGETAQWKASDNLFSLEQPASNSHYRSHTIARNANNTLQTLSSRLGIIEASRTYFTEPTEVTDVTSESGTSESNRGLLKLDGGVEAPIGHATENGSYFAFTFNTSDTSSTTDRGTGMIIGTELSNVSPVFPEADASSQAIYQIQGNSFSIEGNSNSLQNLNGSTLHITNRTSGETNVDCHATLKLSRIYVSHTLDGEVNVLSNAKQSNESEVASNSCRIAFNEIEIGFPEVFGQALTLKGFVSKTDAPISTTPGNLLSLLWLQENSIGLIFAGKEQVLKAGFE